MYLSMLRLFTNLEDPSPPCALTRDSKWREPKEPAYNLRNLSPNKQGKVNSDSRGVTRVCVCVYLSLSLSLCVCVEKSQKPDS